MSNLSSNGRSAFHVPEPVARPVPLFYHIESTKHVWGPYCPDIKPPASGGRKRSKHVVSEEEKAFTARFETQNCEPERKNESQKIEYGVFGETAKRASLQQTRD